MKVIIENTSGLPKYVLGDEKVVSALPDSIVVGEPAEFIIGDMNSNNATVFEGITDTPSDWVEGKYTFDGTTWAINPDWGEPKYLSDGTVNPDWVDPEL